MTITPFQIYLWGMADNLKAFCVASCFIVGIATFLWTMARHIEDGVLDASMAKRAACIIAVITTTWVLVPSSKTIAAMYIIPGIANSSVVQKDMPEAYELAKRFLMEKLTKKDE